MSRGFKVDSPRVAAHEGGMKGTIQKVCPWCDTAFDVPRKHRRQRCCSPSCHGHWTAVKRGEAAYRRMGKTGGRRSGQARRARVVTQLTRLMCGPLGPLGTVLYLTGFQHGQNTASIRLRRAAAARAEEGT
jgi:hypothetical protein